MLRARLGVEGVIIVNVEVFDFFDLTVILGSSWHSGGGGDTLGLHE
jgi:hypothetical protein